LREQFCNQPGLMPGLVRFELEQFN
jgi:hypothetical protein